MSENHTSIKIAGQLQQVVDEWEIGSKVRCTSTDNAHNIVSVVVEQLEWQHVHVPCAIILVIPFLGDLGFSLPLWRDFPLVLFSFPWPTTLATQDFCKQCYCA